MKRASVAAAMFATALVFTVAGCLTGAIPSAGKAAPAAHEELAPPNPITFATVGSWTAGGRDGATVRIVLLPGDAAALVRAWRGPVEVRLADGTRAGEATAAALLPDGRLRAAARLNRAGARAYMGGSRELDASFVAEDRGGALVPVAVDHFTLCGKRRWQ